VRQAKIGDTVIVNYASKFKDGTVFDSSEEGPPLQFTIGDGRVLPAFEKAIVGMTPGESKVVEVPAQEAYGRHREDGVVRVDRGQLPADAKPEVGKWLQLPSPDGRFVSALITEVAESMVTMDVNHPLAGKDLIFDIQLVEVS
jgi:peptidylprolyl isomerase